MQRTVNLPHRQAVYIAGPMSGAPDHNFPAFDRAAALLTDAGYDPVSPADVNRWHGEVVYDFEAGLVTGPMTSWERCMRHDVAALATCDAVALLPGWETSQGATIERKVAAALHIPAIHVDPDAGTVHRRVLIGLCGYARSGKDAVAASICRQFAGFHRVAFADRLKALLAAIDPLVTLGGGEISRISTAMHQLGGWDAIKAHPHVRTLLQVTGNEVRNHLHPDVWVDAAIHHAPRLAVVSDVRYRNEAERVRAEGGVLIRVTRPGVGPANDHISETDLDGVDADYTVANDGSLEDLDGAVAAIVGPLAASAIVYERPSRSLARSSA